MQTYTIDSGNTFLKIGVFQNNVLTDVKKLSIQNFDFIFKENSSVIYSNVSKEITSLLPRNAKNANDLITDFQTFYDQNKLGIDRKVISYYLQKKFPNEKLLLVDTGSFITLDEIDHGKHLGGPIFLGLGNYLRSYPEFSANLPLLREIDLTEMTNTQQAISHAYAAYVDMITSQLKKYNQHRIILTGGDSQKLKDCGEIQNNLIHQALFSLQNSF
ncbi:pantothenate kinase, type III [Bacteriovorax sp. BAL6_X]|uniref:type III pantothenate kinase n=1 Tax=Bacteriovorax sp. BAL6_X TaxID=1201290 RepID=UPI00038616A3|nr:type III pantothenate kinase [Bacteriovorax sp. BAL6_X]EPZ49538.1 pantothenate kinase, type III [Bacteriovorax sp. BAL6_X]